MLLIATDEAGYGPKLGPLVVAATAWQIPCADRDEESLAPYFSTLRATQRCGDNRVVVADSKSVYQPGKGLDSLHAAVSAACHWCGGGETTLWPWLDRIASHDVDVLRQTAWLRPSTDPAFLSAEETLPLRNAWSEGGLSLTDVAARVISAQQFNEHCGESMNKAQLLSEATTGLIRDLVSRPGEGVDEATVFCDRHGGRRYYAGVLQHVFPDATIEVISETSRQSVYRMRSAADSKMPSTMTVHFTVKGESFTPVAMSSMIAKYLRQRMMESFNAYFVERHAGPDKLQPTAGYPVDADRFLEAVSETIRREKLSLQSLVRSR